MPAVLTYSPPSGYAIGLPIAQVIRSDSSDKGTPLAAPAARLTVTLSCCGCLPYNCSGMADLDAKALPAYGPLWQ
jgi:hypothetical protein